MQTGLLFLSNTSKSRKVLTLVVPLAQVLIVTSSSYCNLLKICTCQLSCTHDKPVIGISLIPYPAISECMQATFSSIANIPLFVIFAFPRTLLTSTLVLYSKIIFLFIPYINLGFYSGFTHKPYFLVFIFISIYEILNHHFFHCFVYIWKKFF